jgi:hypothetical protein
MAPYRFELHVATTIDDEQLNQGFLMHMEIPAITNDRNH